MNVDPHTPNRSIASDTAALKPEPQEDLNTCTKISQLLMPARLVVVRHGESEANVINRQIKLGQRKEYPPGFAETPDREFRLSTTGREQATATGVSLRKLYPDGFDVVYVSDHTRAKETAGLVFQTAGWHEQMIRIDPLLGERNWGRFAQLELARRDEILNNRHRDPLHNPMPDGETLLQTRNRSRDLLERCAREFAGKRVLVFSHGEYIEALWAEIAHMNTERQIEFFNSPAGDIKNCQVVEFSSVDPDTNEGNRSLRWVRSSCPRLGLKLPPWATIERVTYTAADLLAQVARYPNLDFS